jgi:large subunit ribosomal protein L17
MRHHNQNRKFGRVRKVRVALISSLAQSLIIKGKIQTTEAKAKEIRPIVEKMITAGKKDTIAVKRSLISKIGPKATKRLTTEISTKFKDQKGGYLRVTKLPKRISDGSPMAVVEII